MNNPHVARHRRSLAEHHTLQCARRWLEREVNPHDPADVAVYVGTGQSLMRQLMVTLDRRGQQ